MEGNPLTDVNLESVKFVMKGGIVARNDFAKCAESVSPFGALVFEDYVGVSAIVAHVDPRLALMVFLLLLLAAATLYRVGWLTLLPAGARTFRPQQRTTEKTARSVRDFSAGKYFAEPVAANSGMDSTALVSGLGGYSSVQNGRPRMIAATSGQICGRPCDCVCRSARESTAAAIAYWK